MYTAGGGGGAESIGSDSSSAIVKFPLIFKGIAPLWFSLERCTPKVSMTYEAPDLLHVIGLEKLLLTTSGSSVGYVTIPRCRCVARDSKPEDRAP